MDFQQNQKNNVEDLPICWQHMAEPQEDHSDTKIVIELACNKLCSPHPTELEQRSPNFFDGKVALSNQALSLELDYCAPAPFDHPNLQRACELIRLWPTIYTQFQNIVKSLTVFVDTRDLSDRIVGSISCHAREFGYIAATVNNHVGFAGALVHEMAHHKLFAMGVQIETADRIVKNPPEQRYKSPVRYDCFRPMPAILHGQYSFTHVFALQVKIIKAGEDRKRDRYVAEHALVKNLARLKFGLKVIKEHAEVDESGYGFLEGLFSWSEYLFDEASKILDEFKIAEQVFRHPLGEQPEEIKF